MDSDYDWTERLIATVEEKPLLYNKSLQEYSNKDLKTKAWREVCEAVISNWADMDEEERKLTANRIQQRWTNLRNSFLRELREQKKGSLGPGSKRRRKYIYFEHLLFLLPTCETKEETDFHVEPLHEEPDEDAMESDLSYPSYRPEPSSNTNLAAMPISRKRKRAPYYDQSLLDILKSSSSSSSSSRGNKEEFCEDKSFLMSLLPAFKRMRSNRKFEARIEIMRVMQRFDSDS